MPPEHGCDGRTGEKQNRKLAECAAANPFNDTALWFRRHTQPTLSHKRNGTTVPRGRQFCGCTPVVVRLGRACTPVHSSAPMAFGSDPKHPLQGQMLPETEKLLREFYAPYSMRWSNSCGSKSLLFGGRARAAAWKRRCFRLSTQGCTPKSQPRVMAPLRTFSPNHGDPYGPLNRKDVNVSFYSTKPRNAVRVFSPHAGNLALAFPPPRLMMKNL